MEKGNIIMTLIELSTRTSQNLENPDAPTVGVINYWYRHNIGALNNLINTSYSIDVSDGSIDPDLDEQEGSIFMKLYMVYYYDTKIRANLGAASVDSVLEVAENGAVVRMTNKNEISKSYIQMKKHEQEELNNLVTFYRGNNAVPQAVAGTDDIDTWYDGINSNTNTRTVYLL